MEYCSSGRELAVIFTCSRCKAKQVLLYKDVMKGEHYDYLRNSLLPDGWDSHGYSQIFCPRCVKEYQDFMKEGLVI